MAIASCLVDTNILLRISRRSDPQYEIVSDACVATQGAVLSVKLFSRVPLDRVGLRLVPLSHVFRR